MKWATFGTAVVFGAVALTAAGAAVAGPSRPGFRGSSPGALSHLTLDPASVPAFADQPGLFHHSDKNAPPDLGRIAYKVGYVGVLLLTADRVVRRVDSVMDSMELNADDGTCLRLQMQPDRRGFEVKLKLTRPLGF